MRLLLALLLIALPAHADPLFIAKVEEFTVILHSEPCKQDAVTNLKRRATWTDKTGTTEGCWGAIPQVGLIILYFADRTATALPAAFFEKASGA